MSEGIEIKKPPELKGAKFKNVMFQHCRLPASFVLNNDFEDCLWIDVMISDDFYGNTIEKPK